MSHRYTCTVCDDRLDAYGRDGTRCARCRQPCGTCGGNVSQCHHPLTEPLVEVEHLGPGRIAA